MKLSHFSFDLPDELLAEHPAEHRDESRLMVLNRAKQTIEHKQEVERYVSFMMDLTMTLEQN